MGYINNGHTQLFVNMLDLVLHLLTKVFVQSAEWFVHQDKIRIKYQSTGNRHALLLPTGELGRSSVSKLIELHHRQSTFDTRFTFAAVHASNFKRKREILRHRHVGKQSVVLKHHADATFVWWHVVDWLTIEIDFAVSGGFKTREHHQTGGLAGTRRA